MAKSNHPLVSRRFILAAGSALAATPALAAAAGPAAAAIRFAGPAAPVVSLHMDQPYLDMTGTAWAFVPAAGTRSADVLASLSDEQHRWLQPFG